MKILFYSLIATIIFGLCDSSFYLICIEEIQGVLMKIPFLDESSSELLTGGFSSALSIFIASSIKDQIEKHHAIRSTPLYDSIGILIGTTITIVVYKIYKKLIKKKNNKKEK